MRLLGRLLEVLLILLAFGVLLAFAAQNQGLVTLRYLIGSWQAPLALVVLLMVVIGAAAGFGAALGVLYRLRRQLSQLERQMAGSAGEPPGGT